MKTEFEINKRLAELLGVNWFLSPSNIMNETGGLIFSDRFSFEKCDVNSQEFPDYCNSWADMGPIIYDLGIDVFSPDSSGTKYWQCVKFYPSLQPDIHLLDENPLRAAALVAIEILESRL